MHLNNKIILIKKNKSIVKNKKLLEIKNNKNFQKFKNEVFRFIF